MAGLRSCLRASLSAALLGVLFTLTVGAASLPTPTTQIKGKPSPLVGLLQSLPPDAHGARWELANISLDVLLSSYREALRDSSDERPRSAARQAKLYRWQKATQTLIASIEDARNRLLVDSDFLIYTDAQGQLILTVGGRPLSVTGLGSDDDRKMHATIFQRYCMFNDCGSLLADESNAATEPPPPSGHWRISQTQQPQFIIQGLLQCRFDDLTARELKATACRELAKQLSDLIAALRAAHDSGIPVDWTLVAASRRPSGTDTLLILNPAGDYLTLGTPLLARLPLDAWRDLITHIAKLADSGLQDPHVIDGAYLLADTPNH